MKENPKFSLDHNDHGRRWFRLELSASFAAQYKFFYNTKSLNVASVVETLVLNSERSSKMKPPIETKKVYTLKRIKAHRLKCLFNYIIGTLLELLAVYLQLQFVLHPISF